MANRKEYSTVESKRGHSMKQFDLAIAESLDAEKTKILIVP